MKFWDFRIVENSEYVKIWIPEKYFKFWLKYSPKNSKIKISWFWDTRGNFFIQASTKAATPCCDRGLLVSWSVSRLHSCFNAVPFLLVEWLTSRKTETVRNFHPLWGIESPTLGYTSQGSTTLIQRKSKEAISWFRLKHKTTSNRESSVCAWKRSIRTDLQIEDKPSVLV